MIRGYYFITDAELSRAGNASDIKQALEAQVNVVQYRNKNASTKDLYNEALELRNIYKRGIFLVNDRVDIALAVGADGVHLGQDDMPYPEARKLLGKKRVIGVTVHSVKEALAAQELGADYIGVSPVFSTSTKADAGQHLGIEGLKKIHKHVTVPIVAIGGINLANASEVIGAGANAVCAISAVITQQSVSAEIKKFQALFKS